MTHPEPSLALADWAPRSQLRRTLTRVPRPRVAAIDVHNHLGRWLTSGDWRAGSADWMVSDVGALIDLLDEAGVDTIVNLDGMWGAELDANLARYDRVHPGRVVTFCQLDWGELARPGGVGVLKRSLADSVGRGARGLKVWKTLGLNARDADGTLIRPSDPRAQEVLAEAGVLGLPVLIHVADPLAFFEPLDERNERYDELSRHPEWWFGDRRVHPPAERLLDDLSALLDGTPHTNYIGAHVGCIAEDLDRVDALLGRHANLVVDIAGRLAELGRQPRRFHRLVERHPTRILFGTDAFPVTAAHYEVHYRFLESDDESFDYDVHSAIPSQGRWSISAAALPPRLLDGLYAGNARRVLGL